jgi:hypothetical protein
MEVIEILNHYIDKTQNLINVEFTSNMELVKQKVDEYKNDKQ